MNEIATQANPMKGFQEKLEARVREDIANLLPEEAVNELVKRAVEDTFFKPRIHRTGGWNDRAEERPSWFVECVTKAAEPVLRVAVENFIRTNSATIEKAVSEYLTPQNLTLVAVKEMSSAIGAAIDHLSMTLQQMANR